MTPALEGQGDPERTVPKQSYIMSFHEEDYYSILHRRERRAGQQPLGKRTVLKVRWPGSYGEEKRVEEG